MLKTSKRSRVITHEECSIYKRNGTSCKPHNEKFYAYKGGPFEGNFKWAAKSWAQSQKESRKKSRFEQHQKASSELTECQQIDVQTAFFTAETERIQSTKK